MVLLPFWRHVLDRMYEFDPATGQLLHEQVVIGIPKGNIKTETLAFIGLAELAGPVAPTSPNVAITAASWEQADKLYGVARVAVEEGELAPFVDGPYDAEMMLKGRPGKLRRTAAVGGTNDGGLETCHIGDELHEWEGENRERVWTVFGNSLKKRRPRSANPLLRIQRQGALQIGISTAGDDLDGLLGRLYTRGVRAATGEQPDPRFLFIWWEAGDGYELTDTGSLKRAIIESNPAAGEALSLEGLMGRYLELSAEGKHYEFLRYHLNRWVSSPEAWLTADCIESRVRRDEKGNLTGMPPRGTRIVLGFDGSNNRDCTALIGWTIDDDYGFVIDVWEPQNGEPVPRTSVDAKVKWAFDYFTVVEFAGDPPGWRSELEAWEAEFGTREYDEEYDRVRGSGKVLRFPTFVYARFGPACAETKTAFIEGGPEIQGHPLLIRHLKNAHGYDTRHGQVIVKETKNSVRRIDAADAAIIARHRARWHAEKKPYTRQPRAAMGF